MQYLIGVNTKTTKERIAILDLALEIENLDELNKTLKALRTVDSIYEVRRKNRQKVIEILKGRVIK